MQQHSYIVRRSSANDEHAHIALLENSLTKQNVAVGFAAARCVLQGGRCWFSCLVITAKGKGTVRHLLRECYSDEEIEVLDEESSAEATL